ncbi:MAG: TRIC cation channel family protein [Solirubrobacterales bacterium]|nr:TRIC cation channel family protein [Solirubrobacterales bacterium]
MDPAVQTPLWIDITACTVGGLAGAAVAARMKMDIVGVFALALITGLGGGILRDVLLNQVPAALKSPWFIVAASAAALAVFLFQSGIHRINLLIVVLDAFALGIYGVVGADKALVNGINIVPALLVGVVTAVGGGVLRDLFSTRTPQIFQAESPIYAIAALLGVAAYIAMNKLGVALPVAAFVAVGMTVMLRLGAWRRGWAAPRPLETDLTAKVAQKVRRRD